MKHETYELNKCIDNVQYLLINCSLICDFIFRLLIGCIRFPLFILPLSFLSVLDIRLVLPFPTLGNIEIGFDFIEIGALHLRLQLTNVTSFAGVLRKRRMILLFYYYSNCTDYRAQQKRHSTQSLTFILFFSFICLTILICCSRFSAFCMRSSASA